MIEKEILLQRLEEIGQSLQKTDHALALLGLGSVGIERQRLDCYSDLDFFVIVQVGYRQTFLDNTNWLSNIRPVPYMFRNSEVGYKLLFDDQIFCEFAIFEPQELATAVFSEGKIIWAADSFDQSLCIPKKLPAHHKHSLEYRIGEALTNLYIGMGRYLRGEKLSAARFVQQYALDHVLMLAAQLEKEQSIMVDPFSKERRYEKRFPEMTKQLPHMMQGYEKTPHSALAILQVMKQLTTINICMEQQIMERVQIAMNLNK